MKWDIDKANGVLWIGSEATKSLLGTMQDKVGIRFTEVLVYGHEHLFKWCTLEAENEKIGYFLVQRFKDKKFTKKFLAGYKKFDVDSIKELNRLDSQDFSAISDKKLFATLIKANNMYIKNFDFGFIIEPMDYVMPALVEAQLSRHGCTPAEISDMMAIADTSMLNLEKQKLIAIAKQPKERQPELLKKHAYEYRWLESAHLGRKDLPLSFFSARLRKIKKPDKELAELKAFKNNTQKRKDEIAKKCKLGHDAKVLLDIADIIGPLHDRRKELFLRSIYTVDTARAEIAKRFGYTKEQLAPFQVEDLLKLGKGIKIDTKYADALAKEGLFYAKTKGNIWEYYAGKKARMFAKKELSEELTGITEFKGMIANHGKARGAVKIVHGPNDAAKMNKGDIVVSSMTKPEFLQAIKKSGAIVTDEGGVTCHAAIVARELGIPCIIGTKIATHVLKDGDLVEVDADNGVVRKIG
jgi:phosphohistidine swiveling domain-containing protein